MHSLRAAFFPEFASSPLFLMNLVPSQHSWTFKRMSVIILGAPQWNRRNLFLPQPFLSVPWSSALLSLITSVSTSLCTGQIPTHKGIHMMICAGTICLLTMISVLIIACRVISQVPLAPELHELSFYRIQILGD